MVYKITIYSLIQTVKLGTQCVQGTVLFCLIQPPSFECQSNKMHCYLQREKMARICESGTVSLKVCTWASPWANQRTPWL